MILETGDMWSVFGETDLWLFTGNRYVNAKGELVMGRGLALEVKKRFPQLPYVFGQRIKSYNTMGLLSRNRYGLITVSSRLYDSNMAGQDMGVFQVKDHWSQKANLHIISHASLCLEHYIRQWQLRRVDLNYPGIGYGKLPREEVLPIISDLPECVHVWEKG